MTDPSPTQMLYEGAHDAIETMALLRKGLGAFLTPSVMDMLDHQIASLEYAIEAHEKEKGL